MSAVAQLLSECLDHHVARVLGLSASRGDDGGHHRLAIARRRGGIGLQRDRGHGYHELTGSRVQDTTPNREGAHAADRSCTLVRVSSPRLSDSVATGFSPTLRPMSKVAVYQFEVYEPAKHRWTPGTGMATLEAIERMGGVTLRKTERMVARSLVDAAGYLKAP